MHFCHEISAQRTFLSLIASFLFTLALASCSNEPESPPTETIQESTPSSQNKEKKNIALVMKTLTNPFFIEMERGARRAEEDLGINLQVKTAAQETSIQQQIGIVESLISDKVDAIVIAPGDSVELIPVLKLAQDAGIVIINIDNELDPLYSEKVGLSNIPFISVDNEQGAYNSVKTVVQQISKPTAVAILEGIREAKNADDRKNGAIRAFNESPYTNIVAMETAHWKIDEGYEVTKRIFSQHPEIGALFCANDMMALGAIRYLQSNGRDDVLVAAFDALELAVKAVNEGTLVATIDQQAAEQGYQGVVFAHKALAGEKLPEITLIDTLVITRK